MIYTPTYDAVGYTPTGTVFYCSKTHLRVPRYCTYVHAVINRFWRLPSAARLLYVSSLLLVRMNRTRLVAVYGCPTSVPAKQLETTQNRRIVRMAIRD